VTKRRRQLQTLIQEQSRSVIEPEKGNKTVMPEMIKKEILYLKIIVKVGRAPGPIFLI